MNRDALAKLPAKYRESIQRQRSRDLAKGNGPTVRPDMPRVNAAQDRRETKAAIVETREATFIPWFRTSLHGNTIATVMAARFPRANRLTVRDGRGECDVDIAGPDAIYHPTWDEAVDWVRERNRQNISRANAEAVAFDEWAAACSEHNNPLKDAGKAASENQ